MTLQILFTYIAARAKEPSTWSSIAVICGVLATQLPNEAKPFTLIAAVASALVGVLRKEAQA